MKDVTGPRTYAQISVYQNRETGRWVVECADCGVLHDKAHRSAWAQNLLDHHASLHRLGMVEERGARGGRR